MHTERSFLHQIPSRVTAMCSQITPNHVNSNCVTGKKLIFTTIENWYRKLWESMTIALSPFLYTNLSKLFSPFMPIKKKNSQQNHYIFTTLLYHFTARPSSHWETSRCSVCAVTV